MLYTVNPSQGLHINISHPLMDRKNFLYWWVIYEKIILKLMPKDRRKSEFAQPLTKFKHEMINTSLTDKYVAVRTHGGRLEVRLREGSMSFFDIYFWLLFCVIFLFKTITSSIEKHTGYINKFTPYKEDEKEVIKIGKSFSTIEEGLKSLMDFVEDDGVQKMILERYNTYNNEKIYFETSGKTIIEPPWKTMSEEKQKEIYNLKYNLPI
jgi:hypothetical protein